MSDRQLLFCGNDKKFLLEELTKESNNSNGGTAFRIPSLIKSNSTLVAAIDRQSSGADWGYIEVAVRTSDDNGKTWSDLNVIASPPARDIRTTDDYYKSAFFIDPCMAIAPNGDIIMVVDFWPECKGIHARSKLDKKKLPYSMYNGKLCPTLYDRNKKFYLIRDDGVVLDSKMKETEYKVTDWQGSLYKGEKYIGNIYLNGEGNYNSNIDFTTFGAPLKAPKRSYLYMLKSSDNGKTWSEPVDITSQVLLPQDGTFLGVAPGVGLTTKDGKIIIPLYVDKKQAVAIFSVDNGETWHRMNQQPYCENIDEWQAVQAPDSTILGLGRQKRYGKTPLSISTNQGKIWEKAGKTKIYAPKCQKSVINIGNYVFCSHASKKKRESGIISTGIFKKGVGKTTGIEWIKDTPIDDGFFAYSCLTQIDEQTIGVLYEAQPSSYICFKTFNLSELI